MASGTSQRKRQLSAGRASPVLPVLGSSPRVHLRFSRAGHCRHPAAEALPPTLSASQGSVRLVLLAAEALPPTLSASQGSVRLVLLAAEALPPTLSASQGSVR